MKTAARNSIATRCGQVMTVSSGSFWTRTTASCLTRARRRYGRADIGTRCLSISVRRAGSTGGAPGSGGFWSVMPRLPGPGSGGPWHTLARGGAVHGASARRRQRSDAVSAASS